MRNRSHSPPKSRPQRGSGMGAWAIGKPSKAFITAHQREGMPEAVVKASRILLKKKKAKEGAGPPPEKDLKFLSLHWSEEPLLDGASEVGRITLSIDAWWMDDCDLSAPKESS